MNTTCLPARDAAPRSTRRAASRGMSLIDALIALAILCFGLLAMTRLQSRMVTASTDAQLRQTAVQLSDELLSTVLVDVGNAACYTVPQVGTCGSDTAKTQTEAWAERVSTSLPGTVTSGVTLDGSTGRMTVNLTWTARDDAEARQLQVMTDVRP